jgi:hypothetical protein
MSVTKKTTVAQSESFRVIDTVGMCDTTYETGESRKKFREPTMTSLQTLIASSIDEAPHGIHCLLVVARADVRMTAEETTTILLLVRDMFPGVADHAILLFTHADRFTDRNYLDDRKDPDDPKDLAASQQAWLREWREDPTNTSGADILGIFGDRCLFLDTQNERGQRTALINMIRGLPGVYTQAIYMRARQQLHDAHQRHCDELKAKNKELDSLRRKGTRIDMLQRQVNMLAKRLEKAQIERATAESIRDSLLLASSSPSPLPSPSLSPLSFVRSSDPLHCRIL